MSLLPKYYSQVCVHKSADYSECENFQIKLGNPHRYEIGQQLGRGNYSDVFQGLDTAVNKSVVIKLLKPVKIVKVKKEIKILQLLNGMNNTIKMLDVVKLANQKAPSLIFEHVNNACEHDFRKFYSSLDDQEVKYYMLELLKALDYINSKGIMHRDIKPHNIVIDHQKKKLKLIDFGLADYYIPK